MNAVPQEKIPPIAQRDPAAQARHRRETFWQITLPVLLFGLLLLVLAVLIVGGTAVEASLWADVALIWLLAPLLVLALVPLAVLIALSVGLRKVSAVLPFYGWRLQELLGRMRQQLESGSERLLAPLFRLQTWRAEARALQRWASRRLRGG